jgi:hypothetical protein
MKNLILAVLALTITSFAQDAAPFAPSKTFNFSAQAVALPGNKATVAATVLGGTLQVTENFSLRQDSILGQAGNFTGYYGGFEYNLPSLSKKLNAVSQFDANHLQFYLTASVGVDRVSSLSGDVQHYSGLVGGGARYDPTGSGRFGLQLFELRYLKAPGFANNTAVLSTGVKFGF